MHCSTHRVSPSHGSTGCPPVHADEEDLLLCSETVSQMSSSDILSPSPLPLRSTSLPNIAHGSSRTHPLTIVVETATSLHGVKEEKAASSGVTAASIQPAHVVQLGRVGGTDSPLLVEEQASSPSSGKESGILGASLAGERSAGRGKKALPKVKRLLACTISLPATKRIKTKQSDSELSPTELMDTSQIT